MAADSFRFPFLCLFLNQLFVSCLHISTFPKGGRNMWRCRLDHNQIRHIWTRHIWQNPTAVCVCVFFLYSLWIVSKVLLFCYIFSKQSEIFKSLLGLFSPFWKRKSISSILLIAFLSKIFFLSRYRRCVWNWDEDV